jgi:hypothetical protein
VKSLRSENRGKAGHQGVEVFAFPLFSDLGLLVALALLLAGCAWRSPETIVKTQTIEVPRYVREPIPAPLLRPCRYVEPEPDCLRDGHREFCNGQLLEMRLAYRRALQLCDDDKSALRAAEPAHG